MYRELTMTEIKELLRRWQAQQGIRQVARETRADRKTVRRYFESAAECELPRDRELTDDEIRRVARAVQSRPEHDRGEDRARLDEQRDRIEAWLSGERPLRLTKVHTLLVRDGIDVKYPTLRRWAMDTLDWRKRRPTVRVDDAPPGDEAQVDFGKMGWLVDAAGRRRQLWALIVTLSFSRYQFVWPTFEQTLEAVCAGLDAAWRFFGGVPHRIVFDNLKPVVSRAHPQDPRIADAFVEYSQARGFFVDPARVRRPQDKPRVENQVPYVRESWFDGEHFVDIDDARRSVMQWCGEIAGRRIHGTTRKVPREVFETVERAQMLAPPTAPFDVPIWSEAKVHPDHHVQVARALYSVPTMFIGRRVRVRLDRAVVRIYLGAELIKTHSRKAAGERSTDPTDYPTGKDVYALRSVDALIARGRELAPHVGLYMERLLERPLPWRFMRQGYGLVRLCDKYGVARVDEHCKRALAFDVVDVPRIERMLRSAQRIEDGAVATGKVVPFPPRFARTTETFQTMRADDGEVQS